MQTRKGLPFMDCDFSFRQGDLAEIRFAKQICQGLKDIGLPDWVWLSPMFGGEADYPISDNRGEISFSALNTEHCGPTLSTPIPGFTFVYYRQRGRSTGKPSVLIGFQYEARYAPIQLRSKWDELRFELKSSLPDVGFVSNPTTGQGWPYRWQFRHYYESLLINGEAERQLLIDNTAVALETAGKVFQWQGFSGNEYQPITFDGPFSPEPPTTPSTKPEPSEPSLSPEESIKFSVLQMLKSVEPISEDEKRRLSETLSSVENENWMSACGTLWSAAMSRFLQAVQFTDIHEWKNASREIEASPEQFCRPYRDVFYSCRTSSDIRRVNNERAMLIVAHKLGWYTDEVAKKLIHHIKDIRNWSQHPSGVKFTNRTVFYVCDTLVEAIWENSRIKKIIDDGRGM